MTRRLSWAILALALVACSSSSGPSSPALPLAEVIGPYTITLASMAGQCTGAAGGGELHLDLAGSPDDVIGDELTVVGNGWDFGAITGTVNLATGHLDLRLWKTVLSTGAQLVGTLDHSLHFTGSLIDPAPGMRPIFVLGSCIFPASGGHD